MIIPLQGLISLLYLFGNIKSTIHAGNKNLKYQYGIESETIKGVNQLLQKHWTKLLSVILPNIPDKKFLSKTKAAWQNTTPSLIKPIFYRINFLSNPLSENRIFEVNSLLHVIQNRLVDGHIQGKLPAPYPKSGYGRSSGKSMRIPHLFQTLCHSADFPVK